MEPIQNLTAIQLIEQKKTNSVPFLVLCDNEELYIAKTMFGKNPPFVDLINEILASYFLKSINLKSTSTTIIKIPQKVYDSAIEDGQKFDKRYNKMDFESIYFVGSLFVDDMVEMDVYNSVLENKHDFNKYVNPIDFLKIGVFDCWVGNMDRKPENPNILLSRSNENKLEFVPIDHVDIFGYQTNYKALRSAQLPYPPNKSILQTPMSKSIIKFANRELIAELPNEIISDFGNVVDNIDFAFQQVPKSFGLSKAGKKKIVEVLSDSNRNKKVSKIYTIYSV